METRGAVLWEPGRDWSVEEIEVGDPIHGEVRVRMAAAGLCHSDLHLVQGDYPVGFYPIIGGHEGSGIVDRVGPGVTSLKEGDHVVFSYIPPCGRCEMCATGHQNLCVSGAHGLDGQSIADGKQRISVKGQPLLQMNLLGTFAPYVTVHETSAVRIDDDLPLDRAALVGCGVTTGWGSMVRSGELKAGEVAAVLGVGGVGINAVQGAVSAGAKLIFAIDPVPFKREKALEFGATHAFESAEEAREEIDRLTWGLMADVCVVTIGGLTGQHPYDALSLVGKNGRAVLTAMGDWQDIDVKLSTFELTLWQKQLRGALFGSSNPTVDIPRMLDLYRKGRLKLDELVTRRYRLDEINQGYQDLRDGKNLRGLIVYDEQDW
jgi:NDMA-dependent alcohol dehydrogenase